MEEAIVAIFSWGSPVGLAIFFAGLGYLLKVIFSLAPKEEKTKNKSEKTS
ncbi:MAG: hypothetical protein NWF04_04735 [Candidatus Bathyarchaeota archaeon]|nr:hypothetical protein [Candidatus Bathyarchaeota archaeon]